uniref:Transcription factor Spi-C n=1 Tax=Pseudonaja textilis TaxID=8673 RepID=A0A670YMR3_PSETE
MLHKRPNGVSACPTRSNRMSWNSIWQALTILSFCFWAGRKRLRLFEYILESLHNPDMANCIQWIDKANGVFQFISKNKEKLAEQWGERKGNRKVMTYQKMARALRNYGRTGEITKIRRKLTYQFGAVVLRKLSLACFSGKDGNIDDQFVKAEQECLYAADWLTYQNCINQKGCDLQQDSSLTSSFYYEAY